MNLVRIHHKDASGRSDVPSSLVGVRLRSTLHQADYKVVVAMAWISMRDESRMQGGDFTPVVIPIELGPLRNLERSRHRKRMISDRHTVRREGSKAQESTRHQGYINPELDEVIRPNVPRSGGIVNLGGVDELVDGLR